VNGYPGSTKISATHFRISISLQPSVHRTLGNMEHKVTYVKSLGYIFLFAGIMLMITALVFGPTANTIAGIIIFLFALGYLINPAIVYDEDELKLKNTFGRTTRTYSLDDVQLFDGELYAKGKRIKLYRTILVQSEFQALIDHICDRAERLKRKSVNQSTSKREQAGSIKKGLMRAMRKMDPEKIRQN
jgi:hypothetical protein